ncbi:MAG: hypothetical protein EPN85_06465 [Bacteroidetes bacterium]|nr:MAG: hypothetical protein EPN85_06465 [Bacteroidota bacterium]
MPRLNLGTPCGAGCVLLPVELLSFSANCKNNSVKLYWQTASEQNNDYFEVERSTDGKIFESIGNAKGAGNSSTISNYEFVNEPDVSQYSILKSTIASSKPTSTENINITDPFQ